MADHDPDPVPHAQRLLACLCTELELSVGGAVCECCLRPGWPIPPMDACGCNCTGANGQASVQIGPVYPSPKWPRQGIETWDTPGDCYTTWIAELSMTVYRCVATVDAAGNPPTCAQLTADALKIQSDRAAMLRAFACCDWSDDRQKLPGIWTPVNPQGGCAGGFLTVKVDVGALCCPDPAPAL